MQNFELAERLKRIKNYSDVWAGNLIRRKILGLDIQSDAVSAVIVESGIKGIRIEAAAHVPISDPTDTKSSLSLCLETVAEKIDIADSICIASFPADQISYRNIQVPFKEKKKIRKILPFELEPTLPVPMDDLIMDFHAVTFPDHADYTNLVAMAVKKSGLQSYLDMLTSFGIEPKTVTVGGFPTALRLANQADCPDNFLFVDVAKTKATLFAVAAGRTGLIRSVPMRPDASLRIELLCNDILRTLLAFKENFPLDFEPDSIWVTGCGLEGLNFEQEMAKILDISVRRIDFCQNIGIVEKDLPARTWKPFQMDDALALALLEINRVACVNFRQGPFVAKKQWAQQKKRLIGTGILAGLVLALLFVNIILDSYNLDKKINRLNSQIADIFKTTFPDVKKVVDPLRQMRVKIQEAQQNSLFPGDKKHNIRTIDMLNDISKLIPKEIDVNFTRLVIGDDSVMIAGDTDTFNSVDDMKGRLEQAISFQKVTISSANIDRSDDRVRFKLKLQL